VLPCSFTPLSSTNGKTAAYYEPRSVMHTKVARCAEPNSAHKYCVECSVHMMPAGIAGSGSPPEEPFRQVEAGICDLQCSAELYFPQSQPASRASSLAAEVATIPKLACTLYAVGGNHPSRSSNPCQPPGRGRNCPTGLTRAERTKLVTAEAVWRFQ
jgi:hypothetical protein